jgi:hypothetical protein
MNIESPMGLAYWLVFLIAALLTAVVRLGWRYALGCIVFIVALVVGLIWTFTDEDGPNGFAVLAGHCAIFGVFLIANLAKWCVIAIHAVERKVAARHRSPTEPS